jgi:hypothetical protein
MVYQHVKFSIQGPDMLVVNIKNFGCHPRWTYKNVPL